MAQFWVASIPLTPRVTVYGHPIRSSDQIEMIMYFVTLICKSYTCFSDLAVMVLVKNSILGRLLFYQMIIAELFPLKFKVTFSVSRLTLPVIDVSEAPHRDFISIWSL